MLKEILDIDKPLQTALLSGPIPNFMELIFPPNDSQKVDLLTLATLLDECYQIVEPVNAKHQ